MFAVGSVRAPVLRRATGPELPAAERAAAAPSVQLQAARWGHAVGGLKFGVGYCGGWVGTRGC